MFISILPTGRMNGGSRVADTLIVEGLIILTINVLNAIDLSILKVELLFLSIREDYKLTI